jgi:hypothetical protein
LRTFRSSQAVRFSVTRRPLPPRPQAQGARPGQPARTHHEVCSARPWGVPAARAGLDQSASPLPPTTRSGQPHYRHSNRVGAGAGDGLLGELRARSSALRERFGGWCRTTGSRTPICSPTPTARLHTGHPPIGRRGDRRGRATGRSSAGGLHYGQVSTRPAPRVVTRGSVPCGRMAPRTDAQRRPQSEGLEGLPQGRGRAGYGAR